jgi:hypothetical protein
VLADFERYAFELLLVTSVVEDDEPALPNRVLGPSAQEVSARAAPLLATSEADVLRDFVHARADEIRRCVLDSSRFAQARGRVAIWVRRSAPAARAAIAADAPVDGSDALPLASAG